MPVVLSPRMQDLPALAPAVVWMAALFAIMLTSPRLFQDDAANGSLEQMLMSQAARTATVAAQLLAHWLVLCVPLLCAMPLMAALYALNLEQTQWLMASLLLGTPALSTLSALCAALALGARSGLLLISLLMLPLALPVILFGVQAAQGGITGGWHTAALMLLGATACAAAALGPHAVTLALEVAIE